MIGSIYSEIARDNWECVPGRSKNISYDENGNPIKIEYKNNNVVAFVKYLTYNATGKVTLIECREV